MNPENGEEVTAKDVVTIGYTKGASGDLPPYTPQNGHLDKQSPLSNVQFDDESPKKKKKGFFKKKGDDDDDDKDDKKKDEPPPVSYTTLFRFAKTKDKFLVFIGILAALLAGLSLPAMVVLFGRLTNAFVCQGMLITFQNAVDAHLSTHLPWGEMTTPPGFNTWTPPTLASTIFPENLTVGCITKLDINASFIPPECKDVTGDNFYHEIQIFGGGVSIIGVIQLLLGYIMVTTLNAAAENQVHLIRSRFLKATLRQDVAWFDVHQAGEFATRTADDLGKLQEGFGEKLGMFLMFLTTFVASIVNAFVHGWKLTLVMLSVMPLMVIAGALIANAQTSLTDMELKAYAKAGNIAEEVLSAVRTVIAFGGEAKEVQRYNDNLIYARQAGIKRGLLSSIGGALMWFIIFASYSLAFWYGVKLILEDRCTPDPEYDPSVLIVVFFSVLMGAMNMGQSSPYIEAFASARSAAAVIFDVIDRIPPIDSESEEGVKPREIVGNVEFEDVHFDYPSRKEVKILRGLSLQINRGETVALVGESGCGKSTTIQLLQRFYDPDRGIVKVDGIDIKTMNLGYLRDHIGVVGQEPVLFGTTIAENIKYGKEGVQMDAVESAAKEANAHDFIMKLPKQYETLVGERGAQLSGGQKQRIAIARALVRDPKILLLDEATSALDSESESVVQHALEKASQGRTTIIIAHRLSTIRNADKIVAISNGKVAESGTHDELMKLGKVYYQLVTHQIRKKSTDEGDNVSVKSLTMKEAKLEYRKSKVSMQESIDEQLVNMSPVAFGRVGSLRRSQRDRARSMSSDKGSGKPLLEIEEEEEVLKPSYWRLLKTNAPEWPYVVLGLIGSIGMGFSIVGYAILFGEVMGVLSVNDPEEATDQSIYYACVFLAIGAATALACFLQIFMFSVAGEHLTLRLRNLSMAAMLRMDMGWYDLPVNSVGALCSKLASDASNVQGATGSRLGTILQSICTIGASCIISLTLEWRLALVAMVFIPLVLASTFLQAKIIMGQSVTEMTSLEKANKAAIEAISNVRTVASLHKENTFHTLYMAELKEPHEAAVRRSHLRGFVFGFSQSIPFFAYSACMFYGGKLIRDYNVAYEDVFKVAELLILGAMMVGQAMAFAPNVNKGIISSARIFSLLDKPSLIDSSSPDGIKLDKKVDGNVKFSGVHFSYPTRPGVKVLRGLDLHVNHGKVVALVGGSGCGKSTCIQLLERFYDPLAGEVLLDTHDVRKLNVQSLRAQIGIVSQEPVLFDRSIAANIAYGDNSREVSMDEIIEAARKANIHAFITALPEGYNTSVGDKGTQLSGGQKQRIAIARALVRNPKILLLDEATSALDTESEKVVQEALEEAQKGRTCITVAHRLSTIKNADQIAVIYQGVVVEIGTHDELMTKQGHYYKFYETQTGRS